MTGALLIVSAFLVGSIPFGNIFARMKGIDIRQVGSGNIGAANVLRSVGKLPAFLTLTGDIMKGAAAVAVARLLTPDTLVVGISGVAAVAGHIFSVFLRFRGGKGVATALGVLLVYAPAVGLFTAAVWMVVALVSRYSSLGALVSFALLPLSMYFIDGVREKVAVAVLISCMLIARHRSNIGRLIKGAESRIGEKS